MVSNWQARKLIMHRNKGLTIEVAAVKSGMSDKTARKYLRLRKTPSQCVKAHTWRTREDPFVDIWEEVKGYLETNAGFESKSLFEHLQRKYPGRYQDGQLRTLQRKIKIWRATEGPQREVFFPQEHTPGKIGESDFTHMTELGITIGKELFPHLMYHFVLPYSNWETGMVCYGENYESLSEGFQNAVWELGGVPAHHRTDRLSAAVNKECSREEFTARYNGLLRHYGIEAKPTSAGKAHENGDVEQRHHRFKNAVNQALLFRGSRDFDDGEEYRSFIRRLFVQLNAGRQKRLAEEQAVLKALPTRRLDDSRRMRVKVGPGSTIRVLHNTYSVESRLIGETVEVKATADYLEIWYGQKQVDRFPRLRGESNHAIQYRHIIDWLVRKPGAFEQYRYRDALFPTTIFRMAYDCLRREHPASAHKRYLEILHLAAKESESGVGQVLRTFMEKGKELTGESIRLSLVSKQMCSTVPDIGPISINLAAYDEVLEGREVSL